MNQPFYVMKTDNLPSDVQYDVNHHHNHQMYGSSSAVSIHDYWYQAGPSNSWSADSMSSSSESSISVDQCEGVSSPSSSHSGNRNERIAWRPKSASSPFSSIYTPGGYLPSRDIKRKCFSSPPRSIPTWSPSQCVALDAEMVGVGQYGEDSSVARVVIVDWDGHVLFDKYIKQTQHVTDYRTFISGIKPEHLSSAKITFRDARKQILSILYGRFLIGHALKNDLKALGISHPWWLIRDVS